MSKPLFSSNELIMLGSGILVIGIVLITYSFSIARDMQQLRDRFDFEMLDNNNQMSSSEKYYRYLEYSDFLIYKLKKNKNLPIKNSSCMYLDYAQHNALQLQYLTTNKFSSDTDKRNISMGNLRVLYNIIDDYKNCRNASEYMAILGNMLEGSSNIEKEKAKAEERMNEFLYGNGNKAPEVEVADEETQPQTNQNPEETTETEVKEPNYIDNDGQAQTLTPEQIEYINKQQAIPKI